MASSKFSYYRLGNEGGLLDEEQPQELRSAFRKIRRWSKINKRFVGRRRPKVEILGLRRLWRKRKRFSMRLRASWSKAFERLKNGKAHMSDLFAGNYLFMQVNSTPLFAL